MKLAASRDSRSKRQQQLRSLLIDGPSIQIPQRNIANQAQADTAFYLRNAPVFTYLRFWYDTGNATRRNG